MSTSSLTALPSSYPEKSDAPEVPEPPKPVRKTYGRRREPTPPADDAGPSLSSMFTTSRSPPRPTRPIRESPSKALLNRWSTGDASWKTSLLDLGMDKDEDDEVDAEEIEREIARMRANARGEKSSPKRVELPAPTHEVAPRKFPIARLQATTSSSTLTTAPPTSPLRSSPPPRSAPALAKRASSPIKERSSKAHELANMFDTSSDHEATQDNAKSRSSSPISHRSATPTPATRDHRVSRRSAGSSPASDASATPVRSIKTKTKKNRLDAFMADLDGSDDEPNPSRRIESRVGSSPNVVDNFLATLQQSDDEEEAEKSSSARALTKTSSETVALFDEEEEERERAVRAGKSKIKGLKKQELEEMRRDIARNQRSKRVEPFKPQVDRLPISSWAANAAAMLNSKPPALVKDADSPASSPHQVTPEEITAFTPSSTARQDKKRPVNAKRQMIVPGTSSPTPLVAMQEEANMPDWDEEIKPLPSLKDLMAEETAKAAKAEFIEARRRVLQRRKQEQLKNLKWTGGHDKGHSDDDLAIIPKAQPAVRFADVKPSTSRNARNVLEDFVNSSASSRRQQAVLQFTGKRSSGNEDLTETMVDFAGKTFKHGDLRNMNGGSRPAGQKANKSRPITARDLDVMMREKHRLQAQKIQQTKEKAFGVRKRPVPSRESVDFEAQIEELRAREATRMQYDDEEEDEDEEDEDYQGSGEEEDGVEGGDEGEVQYSGEEDAIEAGEDEEDDRQSGAGTEVDEDQENQPLSKAGDKVTESIEQESPLKPSSLPKGDTPPPNREPLAEIQPTQTDNAPAELDSTFVDISGFGSGGGSPGFSQLFEATQMPGATGTDAFAGLREQPAALMPIHAMLPQVDISATQIERDNAMIAAETEGDLEMEDDRPKTQYMNERGLFTQTKPAPRPHVEASSSRNNLAGSSSLFDFAPQSAPEVELSSTQRDTSEGEVAGDSTENSASPRRHRSPSTASSEDEDETDSRPTDAFAKLMAADQRPLTKHQKQAKARIRSNLVDEQADESDEDNWLMPGQKNEDDEEEDEDQDAFLPELVDDQEVSEEDRMKQDALVAQKNREIQLADDAKREAEARKVTEGQYRTKRRGQDFYSDDEDGTPRKKRWSKKQMRQRKIWKEDGLDKLDGEENVFMKLYEKDLDSDVESVDEAPSPRKVVQSPVKLSERERKESIRRVAEMNKARDEDDIEIDLDQELGLDETVDLDTDTSDVETFHETAYSVSRVSRHSKIIEQSTRSIRSTESYQNFVRDESLITRRVGTIGGASVVYNSKEILPARTGFGNRQYNGKPPARAGSGSSGSILLSKTNKFA